MGRKLSFMKIRSLVSFTFYYSCLLVVILFKNYDGTSSSELEGAEFKLLGFSLGVTQMGSEYIRIGNQVTEARLRWFWTCAKRRGSGRTGRRMLNKDKIR